MILGNLIARMDRVEEDFQKLMEKQDEVLRILHTAQGGWKTLVIIGGIGAAVGGILVAVLNATGFLKGLFH